MDPAEVWDQEVALRNDHLFTALSPDQRLVAALASIRWALDRATPRLRDELAPESVAFVDQAMGWLAHPGPPTAPDGLDDVEAATEVFGGLMDREEAPGGWPILMALANCLGLPPDGMTAAILMTSMDGAYQSVVMSREASGFDDGQDAYLALCREQLDEVRHALGGPATAR